MSAAELSALQLWAKGQLVLELGAWHGLGTVNLATTASMVVSVDHHQGDDHVGRALTLGAYLANLNDHDVRSGVVTIVAKFSQILPLLRPRTYGLVVVDGAHDRKSVAHDVTWAKRLVCEGGAIAVHDWHSDDVQRATLPIIGPPSNVIERLACWEPMR